MIFLLILILLPLSEAYSQGTIDMHQALLDLKNEGVVMNLAAHPDDEDGSTLAFYRMKFGVKTYSVMFTRGEGGQNEKGPELYEELGVLRTDETKAAAAILGTEPIFLNFPDFGFSKTATETFPKWGGRTEVLRRLVFIIRKLKPDVIFTNHNTVDGHGQHQAVAITAIAAFDAAADSTFFPEQLQEAGVSLWQPRKMFFRNFSQTDLTGDVVNAIGELDSVRGMAYLDVARNALRMHKTQGLDRYDLRSFARGVSRHKLVRSNSIYAVDSTTFFSGIELWDDAKLAPLVPIKHKVSRLHVGLPKDSLLAIISGLLLEINTVSRGVVQSPLANRVVTHWQAKLEKLALLTCGIEMRFTLHDPVVVARQKVDCTLEIVAKNCTLSGMRPRIKVPQGWALNEKAGSAPKIKRDGFSKDYEIVVGDNPVLTLPRSIRQYNPIELDQSIAVFLDYVASGSRLSASFKPEFEVAPRQWLEIEPQIASISASHLQSGKTFRYTVKNYLPHKTAGRVRVVTPPNWRAESASFVIDSEDSTATGELVVVPPDTIWQGDYSLTFRTDYAFDEVNVTIFDVAVASNLFVGIIKSYDTVLESALNQLGVRYSILGEKDLESGNLSQYSTILIDIRAYLVRDDLKKFNTRLLDYARVGGNVVVMYQRDQEWKPEYAPYSFEISRQRVSVEEAPITVLQPDHPLFNQPNKITDEAWSGWKQERAIYFPSAVSKEYVKLLSSHDPDEPALETGYLVANVGSGSYLYTSYVWYRQLKEMHRGALACFANMISYPKYRQVSGLPSR